jgi:5-oxopent-3-ene-1,2,5-tricarboxylate decarboxylase / 2-hydroxyhepta-2,4-diene-1,7-dioate isomerase
MRTARVQFHGKTYTAVSHPQGLQLSDGQVVSQDQVTWLTPVLCNTVIALGLNYADHVKELSKELTLSTQDEPLVFLKSSSAVIGHRDQTPRPVDAKMMHYECELAVVIGRSGRHIKTRDALSYVAGYTVCNDYAVRDYLENWYRPNFRVKNRDACTVLGPWLVSADEVPDPHQLALRTLVNGQITQSGNTANMIHRIPDLITYLSSFMTLNPGDVMLTGTPDGVVNVNAGDTVITEIDSIGSLINTIVAQT